MNDKTIPLAVAPQPEKGKGAAKVARNRAAFDRSAPRLRKPEWIRIRLPAGGNVEKLKSRLRQRSLNTVCEEASCPNLHECFHSGTATFMILGEVCTRRCSFCDVAHGRPQPPDPEEVRNLAQAVVEMQLNYVVITSVDRDDLRDGGAGHFRDCIAAVRASSPATRIEILTPDFRGGRRWEIALETFTRALPDVFNHNVETVPALYPNVRPGADYAWSLRVLREFGQAFPQVPTKSGIMLGLGETLDQVKACLEDLRAHEVDLLTVGQYLQPSRHHHPVLKYWHPDEFEQIGELARAMGFRHVASGPMVRSSYHAENLAAVAGLLEPRNEDGV